MQNIVVTGASGFVGRALTARLDSLCLSYTAVSRSGESGHHYVDDYSKTPPGDVLIHLAEEPDRCVANALGEAYLEHAAGVVETLAQRAGTFVYASSGAVYGDQGEAPYSIDDVVRPIDLYSRSKVFNEKLALAAGGTVLRLSNLFGPGMSRHNVISDIARQLPYSCPMRVRDDLPVRDFLSVDAVADAILMLIQKPCPGILNLGSGVGISIRNLALLALATVGQEGREITVDNPSARRSVNILDISVTQRCLGWYPGPSPTYSLRRFFERGMH